MKHRYLCLLALLILLAMWLVGPAAARFAPAVPTIRAQAQTEPASIPAGDNDSAVERLSSIGGTVSAIGTDGMVAYVVTSIGLTLFDVRDPAHLVRLGSLATPPSLASSRDVFRVGRTLYIAAGSELVIIDISNPSYPRWMATYDHVKTTVDTVWVVGNRAYIAGSSALEILDVSDPIHPVLLGSYTQDYFNANDIQVVGNLVYVARLGGEGEEGLSIIDVSDPGHPIERTHFGTFVWAVEVTGNLVYSITTNVYADSPCEQTWLYVTDVSNLASPKTRSTLELPPGTCEPAMRVIDNYAYIVGSDSGLHIIDISNPDSLIRQSSYSSAVGTDVRIVGNRAYVGGPAGVQIIDVSNPVQPTLLGTDQAVQNAKDIQVLGNLAYIADGRNGLRIFDVADPADPVWRGGIDTPGDARSLQVVGQLAFIADGDTGLRIFDIADPAHPILRGGIDTPGSAYDVEVVGSLAYIADGANGLQAVDVSNPATPTLGGSAPVPTTNGLARRVQVVGDLAYVAGENIGLLIFDLSDSPHPKLLYHHNLTIFELLVAGDYMYVSQCVYFEMGACENNGIRYNISDPANLVPAGGLATKLGFWPSCMHLASDRLYTSGYDFNIFNTPSTADIYIGELLGYGYTRTVDSDGYCGLQSAGNLIYLAQGSLTILRARPDLFGAEATITSAGGSLVSYDKSLSLSFPSNTVAVTTTVTYKGLFAPFQTPYAGRGTVRSFTLEASNADGVSVTQIVQPYTMVVSYTDSALKSLGVADESSLHLSYWDGRGWVDLLPCAGCALDTQNNRLTVRTNRFAEFVLSGRRPALFLPAIR